MPKSYTVRENAQLKKARLAAAKAAVRFIQVIRKEGINILVLKGTGAVILRPLLVEAWKSMGLPAQEFPKIYSLEKLSPITAYSEESHESAIPRNMEQKFEAGYGKLRTDLGNRNNRIALVDEVLSSGKSLDLATRNLERYSATRIVPIAFVALGKGRYFYSEYSRMLIRVISHSRALEHWISNYLLADRDSKHQIGRVPFQNAKLRKEVLDSAKAQRAVLRRVGKRAGRYFKPK